MTSAFTDYRNMPSKQRIAVLRALARKTVQEADAPKCQCHTFTLWRADGVWRCLTCDPPTDTVTEAVRVIIPGRLVWSAAQGTIGADPSARTT